MEELQEETATTMDPKSQVPAPTPTPNPNPNPQKRKASQISTTSSTSKSKPKPKPKPKSTPGSTLTKYITLLNSTISEITQPQPPTLNKNKTTITTGKNPSTLPPSQLGLTHWSSTEKSLFFQALERKGKRDIRSVAAWINAGLATTGNQEKGDGKSEIEVGEYIRLLEEGGREMAEWEKSSGGMAAVEIGGVCEGLLEGVAGEVERVVRGREERGEREKWGMDGWRWLVDWEGAKALEEEAAVGLLRPSPRRRETSTSADEIGCDDDELLKCATLLKPMAFVSLSTHLFMNTGNPLEDNWQSIISSSSGEEQGKVGEVEKVDGPAIRATAFTDFYVLVEQVTRRVVATVLWVVEARLRATSSEKAGGIKRRRVRRGDVRAAVEMLGLKGGKGGKGRREEGWWVGVASRCGVRVLGEEEEEEEGKGDVLDDDMEIGRDEDGGDGSRDDESVYDDDDEDEDPETYHPHRPQTPNQSPEPPPSQNDTDTDTDTDPLEALDTYNSHVAELALWNLLDKSPPPHLLTSPPKPRKKPKISTVRYGGGDDERERGDWTERVEFWSEWEVVRGRVRRAEFEEVGRRKGVEGGRRLGVVSDEMVVDSYGESGESGESEEESDDESAEESEDNEDDDESAEKEDEDEDDQGSDSSNTNEEAEAEAKATTKTSNQPPNLPSSSSSSSSEVE